jgi:hypothetical protein
VAFAGVSNVAIVTTDGGFAGCSNGTGVHPAMTTNAIGHGSKQCIETGYNVASLAARKIPCRARRFTMVVRTIIGIVPSNNDARHELSIVESECLGA